MSAHLCGYAETGTYTGQVVLVAPDWLKHKHPNGIGVDVCLALEISNLWKHGIQTSGHCCGHGRLPAYISVWPEFVEQMRTLGYETLSHPDGRQDHFKPKTPGLSPCELDRETLERAAEVASASDFSWDVPDTYGGEIPVRSPRWKDGAEIATAIRALAGKAGEA